MDAGPDARPEVDLSTQPKQPERSLAELVTTMTSDLSTLMRKEVELAKVELKEEAVAAGKAGGVLGAGAFVGYLASVLISFALAWLLAEWMPTYLGFAIVAVVYGVVAAVLLKAGRERLKHIDPVPRETVETLKEDVEWAKAQKS